MAISLTLVAVGAFAACPAKTKLSAANELKEKITATVKEQAINEGALTAAMPLDLASTELTLNPSAISLGGTQTISIRDPAWKLKFEKHSELPINVVATYSVTGSNGQPGVLSSPRLASSVIPVTVVTRAIEPKGKKEIRGYIDLILDYSNAGISGQHTGSLTINVECN